jgi:uncharacterized membrane protein
MTTMYTRLLGRWLLVLNIAIAAFLLGALAVPVFGRLGWLALADWLEAAYHLTCHQWAFRSFFLFGQQAVYSEDQLAALGVDPFGFTGNADLGFKMAICERDVAIYAGLFVVGLLYARRPALVRPMGFGLYGLLILPMAVDGFTQLFGWRESTWELRVLTGALFGVASAWLVLPRLQEALLPAGTDGPRETSASANPSSLRDDPITNAQPNGAATTASVSQTKQQLASTRPGAERYAPAEERQPLACDPPLPTPQPAPRG